MKPGQSTVSTIKYTDVTAANSLFWQAATPSAATAFAVPPPALTYYTLLPAQHLATALTEIEALDGDWDGYGALAIPGEAISSARNILGVWAAIVPHDVVPCVNGTLAIEWARGDREAYVEIGKSRVSGYITRGGAAPLLIEMLTADAPRSLPPLVNALLSPEKPAATPITRLGTEP